MVPLLRFFPFVLLLLEDDRMTCSVAIRSAGKLCNDHCSTASSDFRLGAMQYKVKGKACSSSSSFSSSTLLLLLLLSALAAGFLLSDLSLFLEVVVLVLLGAAACNKQKMFALYCCCNCNVKAKSSAVGCAAAPTTRYHPTTSCCGNTA